MPKPWLHSIWLKRNKLWFVGNMHFSLVPVTRVKSAWSFPPIGSFSEQSNAEQSDHRAANSKCARKEVGLSFEIRRVIYFRAWAASSHSENIPGPSLCQAWGHTLVPPIIQRCQKCWAVKVQQRKEGLQAVCDILHMSLRCSTFEDWFILGFCGQEAKMKRQQIPVCSAHLFGGGWSSLPNQMLLQFSHRQDPRY